ncbi:MAG: hypothetical protein HY975_02760 [Candidatus Kerfeldbacteria bacterium]|nr:hypothetical protein [Candidatus Kerfeldbacteria bacterium]
MRVEWWIILGYGLLGTCLGALTGVLLMTKRKAWAGVLFTVGSGFGWCLAFGLGAAINHFLFQTTCYPLHVVAYKIGGSTGSFVTLTSIVIYRRFAKNRLRSGGLEDSCSP